MADENSGTINRRDMFGTALVGTAAALIGSGEAEAAAPRKPAVPDWRRGSIINASPIWATGASSTRCWRATIRIRRS